jgi:hypothetical protein
MSYVSRAKQIGRGFVIAEVVTALSLTTIPITAHAKGQGVGAAIGLGILGGAIAGATVASPARWAYADSAVDSGKLRFRPRKLSRRYRKSHCNQPLEPILAVPADSGNRAPFSTVGSGPAVELSRMPRPC